MHKSVADLETEISIKASNLAANVRKAQSVGMTDEEEAAMTAAAAELKGLQAELQQARTREKAGQSRSLVSAIKSAPTGPERPEFGDADYEEKMKAYQAFRPGMASPSEYKGAGGPKSKDGHSVWAKEAAKATLLEDGRVNLKALLNGGGIDVNPALPVLELPAEPTRVLDLVQRVPVDTPKWSYLSQVTRDNNAAVVPPGELKPVSQYTWDQVDGEVFTVAHLSEKLRVQWLEDYSGLLQIVSDQMEEGLLEVVERLILSGTGVGEPEGILNTTGVRSQAFTGDIFTTIRRARGVLEGAGEKPTAAVMNPVDAESLDLSRSNADGSGSWLMDQGAYDRLFGPGVRGVVSTAITPGTLLLGDFRKFRVRPRTGPTTLLATQSGDDFSRNLAQLRCELRLGTENLRPGAFIIATLAAAPAAA